MAKKETAPDGGTVPPKPKTPKDPEVLAIALLMAPRTVTVSVGSGARISLPTAIRAGTVLAQMGAGAVVYPYTDAEMVGILRAQLEAQREEADEAIAIALLV